MKLFYAETINPRKACAVARYLDSPVEFVHVDLGKVEQRTPAFLAINPNGKVPVLEVGDLKLWEANAIMCHLAQFAGSDLWPRDDRQIEVMRWLSWNDEHFTLHAGTLYFQYVIKQQFGLGDPEPAAVEEATGYVRKFGAVLDEHLQGRRYLVGEQLSVADFAVAITLPYAKDAHLPLDGLAGIERWHARLNELAAWRDPFPHAKAAAA